MSRFAPAAKVIVGQLGRRAKRVDSARPTLVDVYVGPPWLFTDRDWNKILRGRRGSEEQKRDLPSILLVEAAKDQKKDGASNSGFGLGSTKKYRFKTTGESFH